jgi:hypothetical protein
MFLKVIASNWQQQESVSDTNKKTRQETEAVKKDLLKPCGSLGINNQNSTSQDQWNSE